MSPLQTLADDVINPVTDWLDGLGRADELQVRERAAPPRSSIRHAARSRRQRARWPSSPSCARILDLPTIDDSTGVTAEVISQGTGNFNRTFEISKGS